MAATATKVKLGRLTISGTVQSVLNGVVEEGDLHACGPHQFRFALGSGTFSDIENIGETIVIDGKPHVSWVKGKKVHTEEGSKVLSPFLIGVDEKQEGPPLLLYRPTAFPSLQMFYQDLAQEYPAGVALVGSVIFQELHSTYLVKPPIYGENINDNAADYWAKTHVDKLKGVILFGVVIPEAGAKKFPADILQKAFYRNPHEVQSSSLLSHTHGGVTDSKEAGSPQTAEEFFRELGRRPVKAVRHVLTSSLIKEAAFALYAL